MTVLVTGGAGFIGSVLLRELNAEGCVDILVVDNKGDPENCPNLKKVKYAHYLEADQLFSSEGREHTSKVSKIFHLGACSSTTELDVEYLRKNNIEYSQQIFNLALEQRCPLIYASSAATYGDGAQGYSDSHDELAKLRPLNPYGDSKHIFDRWVLEQKECPNPWFGLKFFNVYGPNEYHKGNMRSLVHKAHEQIRASGTVKLFKSHHPDYEDGYQLRDFIYVKDAVTAMLALSTLYSGSDIVNIGTGVERAFYHLVSGVFTSMGLDNNIEYIDMPLEMRPRYQYFTRADMNKFKSLLPTFKFHSLEEGVADYVQNYLQQEDCYY